jgi:hypothetical protein
LKQIEEHTAAQYANALEVLENETPKALTKDPSGSDHENNDPHNQPTNHSPSSNVLVKLDLSRHLFLFLQNFILVSNPSS